MLMRVLITIFFALVILPIQADPLVFKDSTRFRANPYVQFESLRITASEASQAGTGVWIQIKLDFTGLKIGGRLYGSNGGAQISLDSNYKDQPPRYDLGIKAPGCNGGSHNFPHYSIASLSQLVAAEKLQVGSADLKQFSCDLRAYVGRYNAVDSLIFIDHLTAAEKEFVVYVLANASNFIEEAIRVTPKMTNLAKNSWLAIQKDFWSQWFGSVQKASKHTVPFFTRANQYDPSKPLQTAKKTTQVLCLPWQLSSLPDIEVLKTILVNAGYYSGGLRSSLPTADFCNGLKKLELERGNGDGVISQSEAHLILALPTFRIGTIGWASDKSPVITDIKRNLNHLGLFNGVINAAVTMRLSAALSSYDSKLGDGNGHMDSTEIGKLMAENAPINTAFSSSSDFSVFCNVTLEYKPSAFDQGLDSPIAIQRGLIALGYLKGIADGIPGPKTCKAFSEYSETFGSPYRLDRDALIALIAKGQSLPTKQSNDAQASANTNAILLLEKQVETKSREITRLKQLLINRDKGIKQLRADVSELQLRNKELTVAQKTSDKMPSRDDLVRQISRLNKDLNALAEEKKHLATRLKRSEQNENSFTDRLTQLESVVLNLTTERDTALANSDTTSRQLADEKSRSKLLETQFETSQSRVAQLEEKLAVYLAGEAAKTAWMDNLSEDWKSRIDDMPIQQRQFCNIASEFRHDLIQAHESANQIRINMTFQERQRSLDSLLPEGVFSNWLVRVVAVGQMPDGSARFISELPCDAMIGSGTVGRGKDQKWVATIPYNERAYRELAKVSRGDFIAIQGSLLEVERFEPGQPESFYGVNKIGDNPHPEAEKLGLNGEVFIANVNYLVSLTN